MPAKKLKAAKKAVKKAPARKAKAAKRPNKAQKAAADRKKLFAYHNATIRAARKQGGAKGAKALKAAMADRGTTYA